jgi:hypothetical protein
VPPAAGLLHDAALNIRGDFGLSRCHPSPKLLAQIGLASA